MDPGLRGRGIGTRLLDFVDRELAERSIYDLKVAVVTANAGVRRRYGRRDLREGGGSHVPVRPTLALRF